MVASTAGAGQLWSHIPQSKENPVQFPSTGTLVRTALVTVLGAAAVATLPLASAQAKASANGDFTVTVNGTTYNPAPGKDVKLKNAPVSGTIAVRGVNVGFDVDPATLGVYNYTLTGAPTPDRMVTGPTVIFASKVPVLTAAQKAGITLQGLEVKDDNVVIELGNATGSVKVQAKDGATGGIFQIEPEYAAATEFVHTLGPTVFYFTNPFTGKINFGNGLDPVTPAQSATGYHQMLLGKDSPQVATKLYQDGAVTRWLVTSGGRMGGVLGEDAIEITAGAANCTSQCQAQERIRGSLPVPPLPTDPTPLPVPAS
jgi:hypothetical protein